MNSLIPYEAKSWNIEGVIATSSIRFSKFVAFITDNSIFLYNSNHINFVKVSEFRRSDESIAENGPNHWIQWVSKDVIAYGNCGGGIFISSISPKGEMTQPFVLNVKQIITATFSIGNSLGICTSNQKIIIVRSDGKIQHVLKLSNGIGGIKNARFYEPSTLIGIVDGKVTQYNISQQVLRGEEPLSFTEMGEQGATSASLNFIPYLLNVVYQNGTVSVTSLKGYKKSVYIVNENPNEIVISEWLADGKFLFIVDRNGDAAIWNSTTCSIHRLHIPNVGNCISYSFDSNMQQLFYIADKKVYSIDFIQFHSLLGSTVRKIINLENNSIIADFEKTSSLLSLFPILGVVMHSERFLIYNKNRFILTNNDLEIVHCPIHVDVITAVAITNMFAVITKNSDLGYVVLFLDLNGQEIGFIKLSHAPLSVRSCGSRLVISSNTSFTILSITDTVAVGREPLRNGMYVDVEVNKCGFQIRDALFIEGVGPILLFVDRAVKSTNGTQFGNEVFQMYNYSPNNSFIMQKAAKFSVFFNGENIPFKGHCLFTDGYRAYSLGTQQEFGRIMFNINNLAPYLLHPFADDTGNFRRAVSTLGSSPYLASTLAYLFIMQINDDKGEQFFEQLKWFQNQSLVNIIDATIGICDSSQTVSLLKFIEKSDVFSSLKALSKEALLNASTSTRTFKKLAKMCTVEEKDSYILLLKELVNDGQFNRVTALALSVGADLPELLKDVHMDYNEILTNITQNLDENDTQDIRFLGAAFFSLGKLKEALACFVSIKDKLKIDMLLTVDDSLAALYEGADM